MVKLLKKSPIYTIPVLLTALIVLLYISQPVKSSSDLNNNYTSNYTSSTVILNQSSISDAEIGRGVPISLSLVYGNGSFLTTGNITYTVKFDFSEPFLFSEIQKGDFDYAKILSNDTVRFQSTPLSKGQNKTGVVVFLFEDGLAEKSRKVNLEYDLTVDSIKGTQPAEGIVTRQDSQLMTNRSGTFANNASLFTNTTQFMSLFGVSPERIAQDLIGNIPFDTLSNNLNNLTSSQLAGVINTVQPDLREKIVKAAPPLSPPVSLTLHNQSGLLNSSVLSYGLVIDLIKVIPGIVNETSMVVYQVYTTWTPCIAFDSIIPGETDNSNIGSLVQYTVKIRNCANINEKINLISETKVRDISHFFGIDKFDMSPNTSKEIDLHFIVPRNIVPGFYVFDISGRVFGLLDVIVAESTGKIPLRVVRAE